jgi:hypothetical protein
MNRGALEFIVEIVKANDVRLPTAGSDTEPIPDVPNRTAVTIKRRFEDY